MIFFTSKRPEPPSQLPKPPHIILQQALTDLHHHCSAFLRHHHHRHQQNHHDHHQMLFNIPLFNLNNSPSFKAHLGSTFSNLHNHAKQAIEAGFSRLRSASSPSPPWARLAEKISSREDTKERFFGVPVYSLANSAGEFMLMVGDGSDKVSLGLFCFQPEHAFAILERMKSLDPTMEDDTKVVAVALETFVHVKGDGVGFRLIPEPSQVKNAIMERQKAGIKDDIFSGVPVFQSRSLVAVSKGKRFRPVFLRMEDLEKSLDRASRQQKQLNPASIGRDIQVAALEDIVKGLKDNKISSKWGDIVLIPPGFELSTDASENISCGYLP